MIPNEGDTLIDSLNQVLSKSVGKAIENISEGRFWAIIFLENFVYYTLASIGEPIQTWVELGPS